MRQQIKNLLAFLLENFLTVHMKIDNITVLYNAVIKRDSEKEAEKEMRNLEESATQQKILEAAKQEFLEKGLKENPMKCEYFLPSVVSDLIEEDKADVKVLRSEDRWYGITYKEDKEAVVSAVQKLKDTGVYPQHLWEA